MDKDGKPGTDRIKDSVSLCVNIKAVKAIIK